MEQRAHLTIVDREADARFRSLARARGLDPDDQWVGRYADYEWHHGRLVFERYLGALAGLPVLEFGCNVGASAIVLAALGADVTAVDADEGVLELARANAARYGVAGHIRFLAAAEFRALPASRFASICCNSVLEYVRPETLPAVLAELDRVLRPGGIMFILGTSNRLWPREVHSGRWGVNYLPHRLDALLSPCRPLQRGIFPWVILRGLPGYQAGDGADVASYLAAKVAMGTARPRVRLLAALAHLTRPLGLTPGMLTPSISVVLRKPP